MYGNNRFEAVAALLQKVQGLWNVTVFVGGVTFDALKDPNAFIFRVQKEREGTRMLTAQEVTHVTTVSLPRRTESSGTETYFSNYS